MSERRGIGYVRLNISAPKKLYQRMNAFGGKGKSRKVNWSSVASKAFEAFLDHQVKEEGYIATEGVRIIRL